MNPKYTMNAEQLASFHDDESRAKIRQLAASGHPSSVTIDIVSDDGTLWGQVGGDFPEEMVPESPLSLEEIEAKKAADLEHLRLLEKVETEIKPQVIQRLMLEARRKVQERIDDLLAEIARLKAENARLRKASP